MKERTGDRFVAGQSIGPFAVVGKLGAGGMGEVYRARDTKLGREVALKVLPAAAADEAGRILRFEREARSLAALNHPHIAHRSTDRRRPRGRSRVRHHPSRSEARQRHGDRSGQHQRAGFRARQGDVRRGGAGADGGNLTVVANSPTLRALATGAGMILGTAAYMSPEQAKGLLLDHRTDVFSFGCVLFELLSGQLAFPGETATDVLASVVARDPDWARLPAGLDPRISKLLQRCLAKTRRQQWQAIGDVRAEIESIIAEPVVAGPAPAVPVAPVPLWRRAIPFAAVALGAGALTGSAAWMLRPAVAPLPVVRFQVPTTAEATLQTNFNRQVLALSPDGLSIAIGGDRLYLRSVSDPAAQTVPGTEGFTSITHPVFSPDGRSIVFWAASDRTLKRITLGTTAISTVCPLGEGGLGIHWAGDQLYFGDQLGGTCACRPAAGNPRS